MAERNDEEETTEVQPKKKIPLLYIAIGLQGLFLIGAVSFFVMATLKIDKPVLTQEKMVERAVASVRDDVSQIQMIPLDEFTVNIGGTNTVIQAKINIEVSNPQVASLIQQRMPIVRAKILEILARQKAANLSHIQGKLQLKDAVRETLNDALLHGATSSPGVIRDVYFTDLILM